MSSGAATAHKSTLDAQAAPVYPGVHVHVNPPVDGTEQAPPF
jgi:hypothetical protein